MEFKGLCDPNEKGILKINQRYEGKIPGIKRYAKSISNGKSFTIQYGNAFLISEELKIPLKEIIKVS